jgi:hypothetical protein
MGRAQVEGRRRNCVVGSQHDRRQADRRRGRPSRGASSASSWRLAMAADTPACNTQGPGRRPSRPVEPSCTAPREPGGSSGLCASDGQQHACGSRHHKLRGESRSRRSLRWPARCRRGSWRVLWPGSCPLMMSSGRRNGPWTPSPRRSGTRASSWGSARSGGFSWL